MAIRCSAPGPAPDRLSRTTGRGGRPRGRAKSVGGGAFGRTWPLFFFFFVARLPPSSITRAKLRIPAALRFGLASEHVRPLFLHRGSGGAAGAAAALRAGSVPSFVSGSSPSGAEGYVVARRGRCLTSRRPGRAGRRPGGAQARRQGLCPRGGGLRLASIRGKTAGGVELVYSRFFIFEGAGESFSSGGARSIRGGKAKAFTISTSRPWGGRGRNRSGARVRSLGKTSGPADGDARWWAFDAHLGALVTDGPSWKGDVGPGLERRDVAGFRGGKTWTVGAREGVQVANSGGDKRGGGRSSSCAPEGATVLRQTSDRPAAQRPCQGAAQDGRSMAGQARGALSSPVRPGWAGVGSPPRRGAEG